MIDYTEKENDKDGNDENDEFDNDDHELITDKKMQGRRCSTD
jgi:hypothetical protein